jgi:site-specific recombinase XerC
MVRAVWARQNENKRLYLVDEACEFIRPVKQYLNYLAALEKSPNTLENYCRHLFSLLKGKVRAPRTRKSRVSKNVFTNLNSK